MKATLPAAYAPPRVVKGRVQTCRLVQIGCAHTPAPAPLSRDAEFIQALMRASRVRRFDGHRLVAPVALACFFALFLLLAIERFSQ